MPVVRLLPARWFAFAALLLSWGIALDQPSPGKKGFGIVTSPTSGYVEKLQALGAKWYYSWGADRPADSPAGVEFVPMVWGWPGGPQVEFFQRLARERQDGVFTTLLGFNEPDNKTQSNIPVATALEAWPRLETAGARLGSPGAVHADGAWMIEFMKGAKSANLRVDFVCVHWYGSANQAQEFLRELARIHEQYDRPIWITEFCPADWKTKPGRPNRNSPEQVAKFMNEVIPALMQTSYVERFAWFSGDQSDAALGTSALFHSDGSLTALGRIYAAF